MIRTRGSACRRLGGITRPGIGRGPTAPDRGAPRARSRGSPLARALIVARPPSSRTEGAPFAAYSTSGPCGGASPRGARLRRDSHDLSFDRVARGGLLRYSWNGGGHREETKIKSLTAATMLFLALAMGCGPAAPPEIGR